ncbi:MAG: hypothetical protein ACTSPV_01145 [Candidatus Hodarchaeales archaeon]
MLSLFARHLFLPTQCSPAACLPLAGWTTCDKEKFLSWREAELDIKALGRVYNIENG